MLTFCCIIFTAYIVRSLKNFKGGLWLGFVREANSSEFRWSDNSLTLYTSWATKEPNSLRTQKSCVFANNSYSNAGRWNDGHCSDRNGFICRIRQGRFRKTPLRLDGLFQPWQSNHDCWGETDFYNHSLDVLSAWTVILTDCWDPRAQPF